MGVCVYVFSGWCLVFLGGQTSMGSALYFFFLRYAIHPSVPPHKNAVPPKTPPAPPATGPTIFEVYNQLNLKTRNNWRAARLVSNIIRWYEVHMIIRWVMWSVFQDNERWMVTTPLSGWKYYPPLFHSWYLPYKRCLVPRWYYLYYSEPLLQTSML